VRSQRTGRRCHIAFVARFPALTFAFSRGLTIGRRAHVGSIRS
jgi:hypothetical protein